MTQTQAIKALLWFQGAYHLQDWRFEIVLSDDPPEWIGSISDGVGGGSSWDVNYKTAKLWVSLPRCKRLGWCPYATLLHEAGHVLVDDAGVCATAEGPAHHLVDRIGIISAAAYLAKVKV